MLMGFRASRFGKCMFCGEDYAPGNQVVRPAGGRWAHADCASDGGWDVYRRPNTRITQDDAITHEESALLDPDREETNPDV